MGDRDFNMQRGGVNREAPSESSSPKRERPGGESLTLAMLQSLLQTQTAELKAAQSKDMQEMREMTERIEKSTKQQIGKLKDEVNVIKHEVSQRSAKMEDLKDHVSKLEARLRQVEPRPFGGSTVASTTAESEQDRRMGIVFGGWPSDTKKEDLCRHAAESFDKLELGPLLDNDTFAAGQRRGFVISNLHARPDEGGGDAVRSRMSNIIRAVNQAQFSAPGVAIGKRTWASRSRARAERERASRASKIRRPFHESSPQLVPELECEYNMGTVFLRSSLLGSAIKPAPSSVTTMPGKTAGTWINLKAISKYFDKSIEECREQWKKAIAD